MNPTAGRPRHRAIIIITALVAATTATVAAPASAGIGAATGDLVQGAVANVRPGATESNHIARVFEEQQDYMLRAPLVANVCRDSGSGTWARTYDEVADLAARSGTDRICTIAAGTVVDSHFIHSDIEGSEPDAVTCDKRLLAGRNFCMFKGTVRFDSAILGVIAQTRQMDTSEGVDYTNDLRRSGTLYPLDGTSSRDLEFYDGPAPNPDLFRIVDANTLYVELGTYDSTDQIRVITQGSNSCPNVTGGAIRVNEGSPASNGGSYADATNNDHVSLRFSSHLGSFSHTGGDRSGTWAWNGHRPADDENGDRSFTVTANDRGGCEDRATWTMDVVNVAPTANAVPDAEVVESDGPSPNYTGTVTFSDPGADEWHATVYWGDGSGETVFHPAAGARSIPISHLYRDDAKSTNPYDDYPVSVRVYDDEGAMSNRVEFTVRVHDRAPDFHVSPVTIDEGQLLDRTYPYTDVDADLDTMTAKANYLDPAPGVVEPVAVGSAARTFRLLHPYKDDGRNGQVPATSSDVYNVPVTLTDKDQKATTKTQQVTVKNLPPTCDLGRPVTLDEGQTFRLDDVGYTDAGELDTHEARFFDGVSWRTLTLDAATRSFDLTRPFPDDDTSSAPADTYTLAVELTDDDLGVGTCSVDVTVGNVAPAVVIDAPIDVNEGNLFAGTWSFSDPGSGDSETWSAVVEYGDGSTETLPAVVPGTPYELSHVYEDDNPTGTPADRYTATVTVTDDDTGVGVDTLGLTVHNVAPTVTIAAGAHLPEAGTYSSTWSFTDPGTGPLESWSATVDYGDGTRGVLESVVPGQAYDLSHVYIDDNPTATDSDVYTVTVTVTDDDSGVGADSATVRVDDVAPELSVTAPDEGQLYAAPGSVSIQAPFTDPGLDDTFTCEIWWDDPAGATSAETFPGTFSGGAGHCDRSRTFAAAGVYTMTVKVTDDDGLSDTQSRAVVVYDPSAGFVTGGGYLDSPAGAYVPDPSAAGRVNFGFNAKYKKGATAPDGQTQLQFKVGDMNFHSSAYEWLVVTSGGTKAQYKGTGNVNGDPGHDFLMTLEDGGAKGPDTLRMKITRDGVTVYDNRMGAPADVDTADPPVIRQGQIVIHAK